MELRVGLCYNRFEDFPIKSDDPDDIGIEWCEEEYIHILMEGIRSAGFQLIDIGKPEELLKKEIRESFDILFSIAEMRGYRFRESLVPVLCEFYSVPYLFARPDAMLITADKQLSNLLVERLGIRVPGWQLVHHTGEELNWIATFPVIVKPNAEGSSMGIFQASVADNQDALSRLTAEIIQGYHQPAMVQQFIAGQELTIGVIQENGITKVLTPIEVFSNNESKLVFSREVKSRYKAQELFRKINDEDLVLRVKQAASAIFEQIGCLDAARIDFRMKGDELYFIEINGLTDFHPHGAFCESAKSSGYGYDKLLKSIILNANQRYVSKQGFI